VEPRFAKPLFHSVPSVSRNSLWTMARAIHELIDRQVKAAKERGRLSDGGLYLRVTPSPDNVSRAWPFMWMPKGGKRKEIGIGRILQFRFPMHAR